MKKLLAIALMVSVINTGISKESKALIGLAGKGSISSSMDTLGTGIWMLLGPIAGIVITAKAAAEKEKGIPELVLATIFAPISGLVMLDNNGNARLKEIDKEHAMELKAKFPNLTDEEIAAFNNNIDILTGAAQDCGSGNVCDRIELESQVDDISLAFSALDKMVNTK